MYTYNASPTFTLSATWWKVDVWLRQAAPNSRLSDIDIPKRQTVGRSPSSHKTQERGGRVKVWRLWSDGASIEMYGLGQKVERSQNRKSRWIKEIRDEPTNAKR